MLPLLKRAALGEIRILEAEKQLAALSEKHIRGRFPRGDLRDGSPRRLCGITAGDPDELGRDIRRSPTQCVDQHSGEHVHALRSRERGCFLVVQTLWAEKIQSTTDAKSLNTFGRNEIEVAPISSALLRIACLVILYKTWFRNRTRSRWGVRTGLCGLALDYLSKMKIAVMVRQLDLGHILWGGRVVRVERAHRVRVVRGVQKMPDVGNGVIGFDHVRFHVRDLVMAFLEDELVRCCVPHHRARNIEVWRSRSMSPARVTRQRRQSRQIVWDDRARMRAVVISELEAIRLVYVSLRMGRVSSIGPTVKMAPAVVSELEVGQFAYVNRRIGRMRSIVGLRERMKRVIGRVLVVDVRIGARVAGIGAAVISQLGAGRFDSVNLTTSIGHSR